MTGSNYTRATIVATTVLAGGILASLAGNLQAIHLDNARPGIGAIVSAIFWPLAIFGVVELVLHTPWVANWRDHLTKLATVVLVGGVAFWVSYWHLANVLSQYGYDVASRYTGPLAVDMAMILAALALNRVGQARRGPVPMVGHGPVSNGQEYWPSDLTKPDGQGEELATGQEAPWTPPDETLDVATGHWPTRDAASWTVPVVPGQMDMDLASVQAGEDKAMSELGQEVVRGAESFLATQPVSPAPGRATRVDKGEVAEMIRELWGQGKSAAETDETVAGWFNCSTRTARRERDALKLTWPKRG